MARAAAREIVVGVIGLGYVGLPLAVRFAQAGLKVIGFDTDPQKPGSWVSSDRPYVIQCARPRRGN